jgi:hypothetical protein
MRIQSGIRMWQSTPTPGIRPPSRGVRPARPLGQPLVQRVCHLSTNGQNLACRMCNAHSTCTSRNAPLSMRHSSVMSPLPATTVLPVPLLGGAHEVGTHVCVPWRARSSPRPKHGNDKPERGTIAPSTFAPCDNQCKTSEVQVAAEGAAAPP